MYYDTISYLEKLFSGIELVFLEIVLIFYVLIANPHTLTEIKISQYFQTDF